MNVTQILKGKERWSMIADDIWDMILGKSGRLPGPVDAEIQMLAKEQGREFYTGDPQEGYPDALDKYRGLMKEKGWEPGQDDEELFEYAMHPAQYEAYKSGKAKADFEEDIAKRKAKETASASASTPAVPATAPVAITPQTLQVEVNGEQFRVSIISDGCSAPAAPLAPVSTSSAPQSPPQTPPAAASGAGLEDLPSPLEGKFFLTKDSGETPLKSGDSFKKGDRLGYVEAMKTYNAILAHRDGVVAEIVAGNGDTVYEDDVLMKIR